MGVSGRYAFSSRALDITQISVHSPVSVTDEISPSPASRLTYSARETLPKVGLSMTRSPGRTQAAISGASC